MADKDEEAKELARRHYAVEIGVKDIFVLRDTVNVAVEHVGEAAAGNGETIKLLEINENTIPSGVVPIQFGPAPASGIHFSSVIVEVTPEDFSENTKARTFTAAWMGNRGTGRRARVGIRMSKPDRYDNFAVRSKY